MRHKQRALEATATEEKQRKKSTPFWGISQDSAPGQGIQNARPENMEHLSSLISSMDPEDSHF
uniref:Uncharacterized protein n=1 Tax=Romanomermis culicivorax TaxID=13658 RepID=A0A915JTE0_ROMCU